MKFVVESAARCCARIGQIKEIERLPGLCLETPTVLLHTRGGSVPHITYEVLQMMTQEPLGIQVPLPTVVHSEGAVMDYKKGLSNFIGLGGCITYCTVQDSAFEIPSGFNDKCSVSIFSRKGRQALSPERYMEIMEAFSPDMYQTLYDGDIGPKSSNKRISNSFNNSVRFAKRCIEIHEKSKILEKKAILGVVGGGLSLAARESCAKEIGATAVAGFVIDGLHRGGNTVEKIQLKDIKPAIECTLKYLPPEKLRILHGSWSPGIILDMVELGIDVFDGSFPFVVTERGGALTFCNSMTNDKEELEKNSDLSNVPNGDVSDTESEEQGSIYEINLKDKRFFDDFRPISKSCSCLTCREHSRSYIHHLVSVRELLGMVLLMIHNLHHYMEFFKTIRWALKEDCWHDFRQHFEKQISSD